MLLAPYDVLIKKVLWRQGIDDKVFKIKGSDSTMRNDYYVEHPVTS